MQSPTEHTFASHDGAELFYRAWKPKTESANIQVKANITTKALLVFHRGHEHSGRMLETVQALGLEDFHVFAWDARGHGRSPGERGSAENLAVIIKDAECFARHIEATYQIPMEEMAVLAHSVGAAIAAAWVHDYAPPLKAMVLAAPAFRVKLYVPLAIPALRLRQKLFGHGYVKSYVKAKVLTHDPEQIKAYGEDPAIFAQIAVNILLDLHDTSQRVVSDAGAITVPTLLMAAQNDWVVRRDAQLDFYRGLSSTVKEFCVLPGFYHAIFHEKDRQIAVEKSRAFITRAFEAPAPRPLLTRADEGGFTRTEFDTLSQPELGMKWAFLTWMMKTLGTLSAGISLGWKRGFDSGETLDYVYANQPKGTSFLGRFMDKNYLESIGWRGIRIRRNNLEAMLKQALETLHQRQSQTQNPESIHIVDIATGVGRYVLETLKAVPHIKATALLRDYKEANLEAGRKLAQEQGVQNAVYQWGDAFDREGLSQLSPKPDLAIVSGLFELIPQNSRIQTSLAGLAEAMADGSFLIYTNQPWHPQLEFIAKVLSNREGQSWIMRRRTQGEMDELVRAAGFRKLDMRIDPYGIFTVSLAVRER